MTLHSALDYHLVRAIREGGAALPADFGKLLGYLRMIERLLHEKASEVESTWEEACESAAQIETLLALEVTVAERAIALRAETLAAVRSKIAICNALGPGCDEEDTTTPRNRMIRSLDADIRDLGRLL